MLILQYSFFFYKKKRPKENWFDMSTLNLQFTSCMLIFKVEGRGWWFKLWVRKLNQVADAREGTGYKDDPFEA